MSQAPTLDTPVAGPVNLPPSPRLPRPLGALAFVASRRRTVNWLTRTYGRAVTIRIPVFGDAVLISEPALAKQIFTTSPEVLHNIQPNLSRILGKGSVFGLEGAEHRQRRKLLTPPFHGKSIAGYENIVEQETLRRDRLLARGAGVRDPRADDADHRQRHPARRVRRRGGGAATAP